MRLTYLLLFPLARLSLRQGRRAEEQNDLEAAYALYTRAAKAGCTDAMIAIGEMYMHKNFRPVESGGLMQQLLQGAPVLPWGMSGKLVPDMPAALAWFRKAAEAGNARGMVLTGSLLCNGRGVPASPAEGISWLERAVKWGDPIARQVLALYKAPPRADIPDAKYDALLKEFAAAVDGKRTEQFTLYEQLRSGSDAQQARLGSLLTAAYSLFKPGYDKFRIPTTPEGLPLAPAAIKRGAWQSFVRMDLNAFVGQDVLIAFTTDFGPESCLQHLHRLEEAGTVHYRSPAFGWLGTDKRAVLLRLSPDRTLSGDALKKVIADFCLAESEYQPSHAAFFTENGEKEYSAEIAAIYGDRVDVLLRYTIGGTDRVQQVFQPELISMTLHDR